MKLLGPNPANQKPPMKVKSYLFSAFRALVAKDESTGSDLKLVKHWEDALEASIAVLAVFAWLAAMTLIP